MATNLIDNFSYKGSKPLDARLVFNTLEEMNNYDKKKLYVGIIMFNHEAKGYFSYDGVSIDPINVNINTDEFVKQSELEEFSTDHFLTQAQVDEFNANVSQDFVKREELTAFDTSLILTKEQVNEFNANISQDFVKRAELDAFDTSLILTKNQVDEFNANVSADFVKRNELDAFDTSKILTQMQVDEFNRRVDATYVRIDELTEIDPTVLDMSSVDHINTVLNELKTFTTTYQQNLEAKKYVMQDELSEIDFDGLIARIEAIETKLGLR